MNLDLEFQERPALTSMKMSVRDVGNRVRVGVTNTQGRETSFFMTFSDFKQLINSGNDFMIEKKII